MVFLYNNTVHTHNCTICILLLRRRRRYFHGVDLTSGRRWHNLRVLTHHHFFPHLSIRRLCTISSGGGDTSTRGDRARGDHARGDRARGDRARGG